MDWIVASEFVYQPVLWMCFGLFMTTENVDYKALINLTSFSILLRSLRITSILNEITLWRNFVRTLRALVKPFFNFGITLYSLYLIYATIGLEYFGGKISTSYVQEQIDAGVDLDPSWVYLNFNDFIMSMNTLFSIMWQNDWEAIVLMYELVFHDEEDGFVIAFFVTFIELANLIFINIIIAFIIDTYQSIDLTLKAESDAKKLKNK